jgi:lipopolysaccharide export system permease protein
VKIIYRYYINEFVKIWLIIAPGLAFIFSLLEIIDKIDDFQPGKITIFSILHYTALILPRILYYLLPMSLLICGLFIFSQASRNKEIIAFKSAGGRMKMLFYPFITAGILFSIAGFLIGEIVVPEFSDYLLDFKKNYMKKTGKITMKKDAIWIKSSEGSLSRIDLYIPDQKLVKGLSIFILEDARLKKRIEADKAFWEKKNNENGIWTLYNAFEYDIQTGSVKKYNELHYSGLESPDLFTTNIKNPEDMGISDLNQYIKKINSAGFRDQKLVVDYYSKISYPMTSLFMIVLGISLSVSGKRTGGGLFATGLGIFISFTYWLSHTFMLSMGYAQVLNPVIAAFIMPCLFGIISLLLFLKIPE